MNNDQFVRFGPKHSLYMHARMIALSVTATRTAQGKKNPGDYPIGSPGWLDADEDFARDVLRALDLEQHNVTEADE